MHAAEFSKGQGQALAITVSPASVGSFLAEFRNIKQAVLDWKHNYRDRCERVMLTVVSAPENHAEMESVVKKVYEEEQELSPNLKSINFDITFLNLNGKPVKEYTFGDQSRAVAPQVKPWWRFW